MNYKEIFKKEYEMLNQAQKQAIDTIYGSIMVVAWPGTGKTQIIWLRVANILKQTDINPENILITTFTDAWVISIKKRLLKFLWNDAHKVCVSTIHSFCQDIISSYPEKFIEYKAKNTIDDIEVLETFTSLIDKAIKNDEIKELFSPFDRYMYLRDISGNISKLKSEWISPEKFDKIISDQENIYNNKLESLKDNKRIRDLEKRTKKDKETYEKHIAKLRELNLIYRNYQDILKSKDLYDFSDMINFVVSKFKTDDEILSSYAEKYQFIMLDEYQDTNNSQNEIIDLILSKSEEKNILVVWDDDQSIYRFQWANIENMLDFYNKYPETKFIVLENNYRSSQTILDLSSNMIENNNQRLVNKISFLEKKLVSMTSYNKLEDNSYHILDSKDSEKIFVLKDLKNKLKENPEQSFAIITRTNSELIEWTSFFKNNNIEVESKLKTNILENKYIKFVLDFLSIVLDPNHSDEKLLNIMRSSLIDIKNIDVIILARELYKKNYVKSSFKTTVWEYLSDIEDKDLVFNYLDKLIDFKELLVNLNSSIWNDWLLVLFQKVIDNLWLVNYVEKNWNFSDLEDIFTLFNKIKSLVENNNDLNLESLLNKFELHKKYKIWISRQIMKKTNSNIEVMTAHASKWLEYDCVYIVWCHAKNWESRRSVNKLKLPLWLSWDWLQYDMDKEKDISKLEKEISLEEDRRLFFVAMTRAKKSLIFTRSAWEWKKAFLDSPFLAEAWIEVSKDNKLEESNFKDYILNQLEDRSDLVKVKREEIEYISKFLENYKLSPTDLNTFLEDPKLFLQNVVFKYPFVDNEYTIFGKVYHRVLELATNKKIKWENVELWYLRETFRLLLDKQTLNEEERNRLEKKWYEWLTWYYEYFKNSSRETIALEYNFRSKWVVYKWVPITWKIDKIDKINKSLDTFSSTESLNSWWQIALFIEEVALVDYKTWSVKSENEIKWIDRYGNKKDDFTKGKYYRQLMFYKLLAESSYDFSSKYLVSELALDFVEWKKGEYKYLHISYTPEDYEDFKNLLVDSREKINNLDFWIEELS